MNTQLIVTAAGLGVRLAAGEPKALVLVAGTTLLIRTLHAFDACGFTGKTIVTAPPGFEARFADLLSVHGYGHTTSIVTGGDARQDSVGRALDALDSSTDLVVIHDAARPFVEARAVHESIQAAEMFGAATVALPCSDTILRADPNAFLFETPDRALLWACQTPQTFRVDVIRAAYAAAKSRGRIATDDATLVRENGGRVKLILSTPQNFKITTPLDLAYAEFLLKNRLIPNPK